MNKLGVALGLAALGLLVWLLHPWQTDSPGTQTPSLAVLEEQKAKASALEKKFQNWRVFSKVLDEIDAAIIEHNMPLRVAADRLVAAADRFYPEWFTSLDALYHAKGQPSLPVFARYLVDRVRLECTVYDNPRPQACPAYLRLRRELQEMSGAKAVRMDSFSRIDACPEQ